MAKWISLSISVLALGLLTACERSTTTTATVTPAATPAKPVAAVTTDINSQTVHQHIYQQGNASLQQTIKAAEDLQAAVEVFIQHSNPANWAKLQQQWLNSHLQWHHSASYLQLLAADHALNHLQLKIHSSEVTPGYLDHIEGYPHSGIVHDSTLTLNAANLENQHRRYSDEETALGMHVLEFFIWSRKLEDYLAPAQKENTAHSRRRQYLQLLAQQWLKDINAIQQRWQSQPALASTAAIKLQLQQQLGALVENHHCQFSQDMLWRSAPVAAIANIIASNPTLQQLQQQLSDTSTATETEIKQSLGELMLNLELASR